MFINRNLSYVSLVVEVILPFMMPVMKENSSATTDKTDTGMFVVSAISTKRKNKRKEKQSNAAQYTVLVCQMI